MSSDDEGVVMRALEEWVFSHPHKDRPFLIIMGRSFTPVQYWNEVRENEQFRTKLFRFLEEQAERAGERPVDMIYRAVGANRR
ncbi:MAG TPA: hypothetical protein VLJ11_10770 [Bryobacteraceae bacterium]|nr:hypothetical protein [Bryobacteraceae bacterium]